MDVQLVDNLADCQPLRNDWQRLAQGHPMRSWHWLVGWWQHFGACDASASNRLFVPIVRDGTEVAAIMPCYLSRSSSQGTVIRFLGDGEVCTEYPTVLCRDAAGTAIRTLADFLVAHTPPWDVIDIDGITENDAAINRLVACLAEQGVSSFYRMKSHDAWRLELPPTWDGFLAMLSKSHRKLVRRLHRNLVDSERGVVHLVEESSQLETAWHILVDLHQRRRHSVGQPGCFTSPTFTAFHHDVTKRLLDENQLRLLWVALDDAPLSIEYGVVGNDTTYAYQSGLDPTRLEFQPGRLSTSLAIQRAITEGHATFDFLRGDEQYKAHFRATATPTYRIRIVANRASARWRDATYRAMGTLKQWIKSGVIRGTASTQSRAHA